MKILLLVFALAILAGCSDIDYPPRPVTTAAPSSAETEDTPAAAENRYTLKRFDITPRSFDFSFEPNSPYVLSQGESFVITVDFNSSQHYRVGIAAVALGGNPVLELRCGDSVFGAFYAGEEGEFFLSPIYFPQGEAELRFTALRGAVRVDRIMAGDIVAPQQDKNFRRLSHPAPSPETVALFDYLKSQVGGRVLSAQHVSPGGEAEIDTIFAATGRKPAVRFGCLGGAQAWRDKGGIVGCQWLPLPEQMQRHVALGNVEESGAVMMGLDLVQVMVDDGELPPDVLLLLRDIDALAEDLLELAANGVPVLFNPLPDGGSRLYWWGASGGEHYIRLWNLLRERLHDFHGADNLIWIWSGGSHAYFPGNNRVDIVGESVFTDTGTEIGSQAVRLGYARFYGGAEIGAANSVPAAVIASSALPSPDVMARDNAGWLMWGLYVGDYLDGAHNTLDLFYNHELTVCLDRLPEL
jgi:mannan endo-1,4-beta-mannosidase